MKTFDYERLRYVKPLTESTFLRNLRKICDIPTSQRQIVKMGLDDKFVSCRHSEPLFTEFKTLHHIPEGYHTYVDAEGRYCLVHDEYNGNGSFVKWVSDYGCNAYLESCDNAFIIDKDPHEKPSGAPCTWGIHRDRVWVLRTPRAPKQSKKKK